MSHGFTLLLGGARAGKSAYGLRLARDRRNVTFIATAEALDEEMRVRIERHRAERPGAWRTIEAPVELVAAVRSTSGFVIVDCLTLWTANVMYERSDDEVLRRATQVAELLATREGVVVTNEVGLGIVPMNDMARRYRDLLGAVNRVFAARATRALLVVAGRVVELGESIDV